MPTMLRSAALAAACASLLTIALPSHAATATGGVDCRDSAGTTGFDANGVAIPGNSNAFYYKACLGPNVGVLVGADEEPLVSAQFGDDFVYVGKSDDAAFGPFSANPVGQTSGTLSFDTARKGLFVVALQAMPGAPNNNYSFYLFDGGNGVSTLNFDTKGLFTQLSFPPGTIQPSGPPLTFAALYALPTAAIPEPASLALMVTGLAALGLMRRRVG